MLIGMSSLFAAPALVRAVSLEYVPRHQYFALEQIGTGVYDVIRDDGRVSVGLHNVTFDFCRIARTKHYLRQRVQT